MRRIIAACGLLGLLIPGLAGAAAIFEKVGTFDGQFLKIDVGARAAGMGGAFVAVADDASSLYWNAAGIARIESNKSELSLNHASWPSEMSFAVSCGCGLEWSSRRPWACGPKLLREIVRFLRTADADDARGLTLAEYVREYGYSEGFRRHYLVPMTAALWSTAPASPAIPPRSAATPSSRSESATPTAGRSCSPRSTRTWT